MKIKIGSTSVDIKVLNGTKEDREASKLLINELATACAYAAMFSQSQGYDNRVQQFDRFTAALMEAIKVEE